MTYYIRIPGLNPGNYLSAAFTLGDVSTKFKTFWPEQGFERLGKIINDDSDLAKEFLNDVSAIDETGKVYTIDEFLSIVAPLNIKRT